MKDVIQQRFPESRLEPLTKRGIARLKKKFPDIPDSLVEFFEVIGCGSIGQSRYMIYDLISPNGIFDEETANNLHGIALVGDDFAGGHEAYNTTSKWQFGTISSSGQFRIHTRYKSLVDFIEDWFCK